MDQRDLFFLVFLLIGLSGLTVMIVQLIRHRGGDRSKNWWEGPWDEDKDE